jgi:hypothetical protein
MATVVSRFSKPPWFTSWRPFGVFSVQVLVGLFTGLIGVNDTASAVGFGNRLRGGLFLLGGIVILIGAIGVAVADRTGNAEWGGVALTGGVLSFVAIASMVVLQWQGGDYHERLVAWIPMLFLCAWSVYRLLRAGISIDHPGRATALLSISTLLPIVSFLGPNVYQPASAPHYLQLNAAFGKPIKDPGKTTVAIPFSLKLKNPVSTRLYVLGSSYSITGRRTTPAKDASSGKAMQTAVVAGRPVTRSIGSMTFELLQADSIVGPDTFLEPAEEYSSTRILRVPVKNDYDVLRLEASAIVARGDRLIPTLKEYWASWDEQGNQVRAAPEWAAPKGTPFLNAVFDLEETSTVRKLTRQPQRLNVWSVLTGSASNNSGSLYLYSTITREGVAPVEEPSQKVGQNLLRRYGLESTSPVVVELSTWSFKSST